MDTYKISFFYEIWLQIENEYGSFGYDDYPRDIAHLHNIKLMLEDGGVESLLFTSDNPKNNKDYGTTDGGTVQYKSFVYRWYIKDSSRLHMNCYLHMLEIMTFSFDDSQFQVWRRFGARHAKSSATK